MSYLSHVHTFSRFSSWNAVFIWLLTVLRWGRINCWFKHIWKYFISKKSYLLMLYFWSCLTHKNIFPSVNIDMTFLVSFFFASLMKRINIGCVKERNHSERNMMDTTKFFYVIAAFLFDGNEFLANRKFKNFITAKNTLMVNEKKWKKFNLRLT